MDEHNQIVVFKLGDESYGVSIKEVKEIIKMEEIVSIPKSPKYIEGILNIRGEVYVIFNMRKKFELSDACLDENSKIILINDKKIGFIVDKVSEIIKVEGKNIETKVEMPYAIEENFIDGVAKVNENIIIVLNLGRILSAEDNKEVGKVNRKLSKVKS